ncbi:RHS repeat domain-containing protein [Lysobacter sp. 22409]|uniref:RHS repeat domain-containing protein n=1 Tax=Lysobacter sp. 22409 TaxID=3453917 RepID=UPI003F86B150
MSQVKQAGVVKASYRYNARGERVSRADNATGAITGYTLYDEAGRWLGDYDANGATKQQAIWLGDAPVGLVVGAGVAQTLRYVQPDHLGTPRAVIDPSRNLTVWTWDAKGEAFGNNPPNQDPDQDGTAFVFDMRFPGQRYDVASGLVYNYFRDYDSISGRYIQSDPIGIRGGLSTFAYAGNAPMSNVDLFGLDATTVPTSVYPVRGFVPPSRTELTLALQALVAGGATVSAYTTGAALLLYSPSLGAAPCEAMGAGACARMYSEKKERGEEYQAYKDIQRAGVAYDPDPCRHLKNRIEHHKTLNRLRSAWDSKWPSSKFPGGRHIGDIARSNATITKLEKEFKELCPEECDE